MASLALLGAACGDDSSANPPLGRGWTLDAVAGQGQTCGVAVADDGEIVIAAEFPAGAADVGGGVLPAMAAKTVVARYAPDGEHLWSRALLPGCAGITIVPDGQIFLLHQQNQIVSITSILPDGMEQWRQALIAPVGAVVARDIASFPSGDLVVVGSMHGRWSLGLVDFQSTDELEDGFVLFLGPFADEKRGHLYDGGDADQVRAIGIGAEGRIAIGGVGGGNDLGLAGAGPHDRFAALIDENGDTILAVALPPIGGAPGVAAVGAGLIAAVGAGEVVAFDEQGGTTWTRDFDGPVVDLAGAATGPLAVLTRPTEGISRVTQLSQTGGPAWQVETEGTLLVVTTGPGDVIAAGGTRPLVGRFER